MVEPRYKLICMLHVSGCMGELAVKPEHMFHVRQMHGCMLCDILACITLLRHYSSFFFSLFYDSQPMHACDQVMHNCAWSHRKLLFDQSWLEFN